MIVAKKNTTRFAQLCYQEPYLWHFRSKESKCLEKLKSQFIMIWHLGADIIVCDLKFRIYKVQSHNTAQQTKGHTETSVLIWEDNGESQEADGFEFAANKIECTRNWFYRGGLKKFMKWPLPSQLGNVSWTCIMCCLLIIYLLYF